MLVYIDYLCRVTESNQTLWLPRDVVYKSNIPLYYVTWQLCNTCLDQCLYSLWLWLTADTCKLDAWKELPYQGWVFSHKTTEWVWTMILRWRFNHYPIVTGYAMEATLINVCQHNKISHKPLPLVGKCKPGVGGRSAYTLWPDLFRVPLKSCGTSSHHGDPEHMCLTCQQARACCVSWDKKIRPSGSGQSVLG